MSEFVMTWDGEYWWIMSVLVGSTAAGDLRIHLYTNDLTPANSHALSDFTEASQGDYAYVTLSKGTTYWTITKGSSGVLSSCEYKTGSYPVEFTFVGYTPGSPVYVYGYYITCSNGTYLVGAERFDGRQLITATTEINITPKIQWGDLDEG